MKNILSLIILIGFLNPVTAQIEFPLYPDKIPNAKNVSDKEQIVERKKEDRAAIDTSVPTLTFFKPEYSNGKAVIICPGGGYARTAIDKEGVLVARSFVRDSITAFVLKYRIPQDRTNVDKSLAPLQDAQQAIRLVRKKASEFEVDPDKIGIMGFSAGGHLASSAATHFQKNADSNETDTTSVRPDFVILIYPVISFSDELTHKGSRKNLIGDRFSEAEMLLWSNEKQVTKDTPPAFLIHTADDQVVPVGNSIAYYEACIEHDIPVEMHLYPEGGHGFGLHNSTTKDVWMHRLKNWLLRY